MIIQRHAIQQYTTFFNPETGFLLRAEDQGVSEPFWSEAGPELIDFAITNRCGRGCRFCYRHSSPTGDHVSLGDYRTVLGQARDAGTLQVALGGGNPNEHPDFTRLLKSAREEFGIVPNYTTNGDGLTKNVLDASAAYCGAIAVSWYGPSRVFTEAIHQLTSVGAKTNIHFLLSHQSLPVALGWLREPPSYLSEINAIIFLTYKPHSRNLAETTEFLLTPTDVSGLFEALAGADLPFKVGFDSCAVPGIVEHADYPSVCFDFCESSRFSMFVSEELEAFPCSFAERWVGGVSLREQSLSTIWRASQVFRAFRQRLAQHECGACPDAPLCHGGCPLFALNLCTRLTTPEQNGCLRSWLRTGC